MFHAGERVLSNLTRVPQWYLGSGMQVVRSSTCTLVERITDYELQSTGFGMTLDAVVLLAHSLGVREDMSPGVLIRERMSSAWTVVVSSLRHNCDPESMAGVHWIRCIRLHLFEPREVRLADDKHACWKKR